MKYDFLIESTTNSIIVNSIKIKRDNVIYFLSKLFEDHHHKKSFKINDIKVPNTRNKKDYTKKTVRAMLLVFNSMGFIESQTDSNDSRTKIYRFKEGAKMSKMIARFSKMK
jgi:hypothetical protein